MILAPVFQPWATSLAIGLGTDFVTQVTTLECSSSVIFFFCFLLSSARTLLSIVSATKGVPDIHTPNQFFLACNYEAQLNILPCWLFNLLYQDVIHTPQNSPRFLTPWVVALSEDLRQAEVYANQGLQVTESLRLEETSWYHPVQVLYSKCELEAGSPRLCLMKYKTSDSS